MMISLIKRFCDCQTWTVPDAERARLRSQTEITDVAAERTLVHHGIIELVVGTELTEHPATAARHHQRYHHHPGDQPVTE